MTKATFTNFCNFKKFIYFSLLDSTIAIQPQAILPYCLRIILRFKTVKHFYLKFTIAREKLTSKGPLFLHYFTIRFSFIQLLDVLFRCCHFIYSLME